MEEKIFHTLRGDVHYWLNQCQERSETALSWLVFLPGLTAEHHLFDEQLSYFSSRYSCFVWDAPAHGLSRPYHLDFTLEEMAKVLHQIFLKEGIDSPIMVGQSYGGYITQMYRSLYPNRIRAFVSVDSCPLEKKYYRAWEITSLKHTEGMYRCIPWRILIEWSVKGITVSEKGRRNYREAINGYEKNEFCKLCGRGFASVAEAIEAERDYTLDFPVLLLCGEKDAAGFTKRYNYAWSKKAGYPLIWVPKAGHNSNIDAPDFVNSALDDFFRKLPSVR